MCISGWLVRHYVESKQRILTLFFWTPHGAPEYFLRNSLYVDVYCSRRDSLLDIYTNVPISLSSTFDADECLFVFSD